MSLLSAPATLPVGFDDQTLQRLTTGLTDQQLVWLSGYLYGRAGTAPAPAAVPAVAEASAEASQLTILFGSQTGNSKKAAGIVAEVARQRGLPATVRDMNEYPTKDLKNEQLLLVVVSTQGEGDPPIAAEELHQFLLSNRAPKLPNLRYAVLALGDKSYLQYCQTGFEFDQRLAELSGKRLVERLDCDVTFEDETRQWAEQVLSRIAELQPAPTLAGAAVVVPASVGGSYAPEAAPLPAAVEYNARHPFAARAAGKDSAQWTGLDQGNVSPGVLPG